MNATLIAPIPDHLPAIAPPTAPDFNDGYFAAADNRPLDIHASEAWKAGWYARGGEQLTAEQLRDATLAGERA